MQPTLLLLQILVHTNVLLLQDPQLTPAQLSAQVLIAKVILIVLPEFDIALSFLLEVDLVAGLHLEDLLVRVLLSLLQHLFHRLHLFTRNMNAI